MKISLSSLKSRISAFIEGWNQWLYDEFSVDRAEIKSKEAEKLAEGGKMGELGNFLVGQLLENTHSYTDKFKELN